MTPAHVDLVRSSWEHASPIADTLIRLFYRRLFEGSPELRDRFSTSMSEQGDHLLEALKTMLSSLRSGPVVSNEGQANGDAALVVDAWTWSLRQEIGGFASFHVAEAWNAAITSPAGEQFRSVALGDLALA